MASTSMTLPVAVLQMAPLPSSSSRYQSLPDEILDMIYELASPAARELAIEIYDYPKCITNGVHKKAVRVVGYKLDKSMNYHCCKSYTRLALALRLIFDPLYIANERLVEVFADANTRRGILINSKIDTVVLHWSYDFVYNMTSTPIGDLRLASRSARFRDTCFLHNTNECRICNAPPNMKNIFVNQDPVHHFDEAHPLDQARISANDLGTSPWTSYWTPAEKKVLYTVIKQVSSIPI